MMVPGDDCILNSSFSVACAATSCLFVRRQDNEPSGNGEKP